MTDFGYTNDKEYRQCLRDIFFMNSVPKPEGIVENLDDVTLDELDYDADQINVVLCQLFDMTNGHILFQELYDLAAARMISMDRTIGQAVLLSYDYLKFFHPLLCDFLNDPKSLDETNPYYIELKRSL